MEQRPKKLLPDHFIGDQVRETIRRRHYSFRTEKSYVAWIRRYTDYLIRLVFTADVNPLILSSVEGCFFFFLLIN